MPKNPTLPDILADEVTQEIADRYFSFRKLIEEEKYDLADRIRQYSFILQKRISFDLIRIYILLHDENLIQEFMDLARLDQRFFFDPYLLQSPTIAARVFECQRFNGWTRKARFRNFAFSCYENLCFHVRLYNKKLEILEEEEGVILEEIRQFYQQNDLSAILGFLRSLGGDSGNSHMQGGLEVGIAEELAKKLQIENPLPLEHYLPFIPALAPLDTIKKQFKELVNRAYRIQPPTQLAIFRDRSTPCPELR